MCDWWFISREAKNTGGVEYSSVLVPVSYPVVKLEYVIIGWKVNHTSNYAQEYANNDLVV